MESRFTPAFLQLSSRGRVTVSGFASKVTSAPGRKEKLEKAASSTRQRRSSPRTGGVPPPMYREEKRFPGRRTSRSPQKTQLGGKGLGIGLLLPVGGAAQGVEVAVGAFPRAKGMCR